MMPAPRHYILGAALLAAACGGEKVADNVADANHISEDPYGATGAPGADLTDNGVNDGASGLADNGAAPNAAATVDDPDPTPLHANGAEPADHQ
jgi:hypothetical protein